jgi:AraC family transcriptional regulator
MSPDSPAQPMTASGRVLVWHGGSLWMGTGRGRTQWHDHHALQITLALEGVCRFRTQPDGAWTDFRGAIVMPHRPHQFELDDTVVANLFVEPETALGRRLIQRFAGADLSPLPDADRQALAAPLLGACRANATDAELIAFAQQALAAWMGTTPSESPPDTRIEQALAHIHAKLGERISLDDVAAAVHLSAERFRHLFVAATGTTFRAYVLWARLNTAVAAGMGGTSWTQAAHLAGFADSAHLNRTFKRMFGIGPTTISRDPLPGAQGRAGARVAQCVPVTHAGRHRPR